MQTIAKDVAHLTKVFQRNCKPGHISLNNSAITEAEQKQINQNFEKIFEQCKKTVACFIHDPDPRSTTDLTPEEREAFWEQLLIKSLVLEFG